MPQDMECMIVVDDERSYFRPIPKGWCQKLYITLKVEMKNSRSISEYQFFKIVSDRLKYIVKKGK